MSKSLSFYNLTGGLNTVQDLATINSTPNRTESPDMMNIEYYKLGGIQTMKGNKQLGTAFSSEGEHNIGDIIFGMEYIIGNTSFMVVATREGKLYRYDKTQKDFVTLKKIVDNNEVDLAFTPMGSGELDNYDNLRIYGVSYNNGIVLVNGYEAIYYNYEKPELNKVWTPSLEIDDGGNTVTTTFHPNTVASYRGRLFMGANVTEQDNVTYNGGMLFYSGVGLGTEDVWQESANVGEDAGAFKEFFEDDSYITALGTWAEYLTVHKEQNTYIIDGTNDLANEWTLKPYSEYTVPSQQSYVIVNNGYYSYIPEANGIYPLFTRNIYNNTFQGGDLSYKIKDSFDYIDTLNYSKIFATHHPKKKYIMFYIPTLDSNGSNQCYIYDIQTKTWLFRKVPQCVTCAFKFNNEVYIGARYIDKDTGAVTTKVLKEFTGKTFDGIPVDFYYLTPPFIWGGGTNKTTTKEFRVKMVNSSGNHFYLESFKDGLMDTKEQRLVKNINDNLNGLIWDIGYLEDDMAYSNAYEPVTFYQYSLGTDYYYTKEAITDTNNPIVYGDKEAVDVEGDTRYKLTNPINYYRYFRTYTKIPGTALNNDPELTETIVHPTYAWNRQNKTDWCYVATGGYRIWVNQSTGESYNNFLTQEYYTWQGFLVGGQGGAGQVMPFRATPDLLEAIKNRQAQGGSYGYYPPQTPDSLQYWDGSNWVTQTGVNTNCIVTNYGIVAEHGAVSHPFVFGSIPVASIGQIAPVGVSYCDVLLPYNENGATVKGTSIINNGTANPELPGVVNTGTFSTGQASITFVINGQTLTFDREASNDRGNTISNNNLYSREETGTVTLYTDSSAQTSTGDTVTIVDGGFTYDGNNYYRHSPADGSYNTYNYYKYANLSNPTEIDGAERLYDYPEDEMLFEQSLTDTEWDTDAWLQQGYQTKRMLLPNQYFETVQFKFSGGGYDKEGNARYNDSICISGFEVEGIQLAETPWS